MGSIFLAIKGRRSNVFAHQKLTEVALFSYKVAWVLYAMLKIPHMAKDLSEALIVTHQT